MHVGTPVETLVMCRTVNTYSTAILQKCMIKVCDISNLPYKVGGLLGCFKSLVDGHHRLAEHGNGRVRLPMSIKETASM